MQEEGTTGNMESLRESLLNLTFQMSTYKRATLDEEDLVDSISDDVYPSSPMQVSTPYLVLRIHSLLPAQTLSVWVRARLG